MKLVALMINGLLVTLLYLSPVFAGECYIDKGASFAMDRSSMEATIDAILNRDSNALGQLINQGRSGQYLGRTRVEILERDGDYVAFRPIVDGVDSTNLRLWTVVQELSCATSENESMLCQVMWQSLQNGYIENYTGFSYAENTDLNSLRSVGADKAYDAGWKIADKFKSEGRDVHPLSQECDNVLYYVLSDECAITFSKQ